MNARQNPRRTKSNNRQVILPRVRRFLNSAVKKGVEKIGGRWQDLRDSLKIPTAAEIDVLKRRVNELEKKIPR